MPGSRPTLTVAVMARDAAAVLPRLLGELGHYADELVVAVDAGSTDGTWDLAREHADRCFKFRHAGVPSPARMACLERATGDWVLFLDDDEGMDAAFPAVRDDLLCAADFAGWFLPRKWIDVETPPTFLAVDPWWPNLALRLVRRDVTRVWKPLTVHSDLRVVGRCGVEPRTAILHYERIARPPARARREITAYRQRGQGAAVAQIYEEAPPGVRAPLHPPALSPVTRPHSGRAWVETAVDDLTVRPWAPAWAAEVEVVVPEFAELGAELYVLARARNMGGMRWEPTAPGVWPDLSLGFRMVRKEDPNDVCPEGRARVGQDVPPGGTGHFHCAIHLPPIAGTYELTWQMVSEHEHWFDELGSSPRVTRIVVRD